MAAALDAWVVGVSVVGQVLMRAGFRVGIIAQPDWTSAEAFRALGKPNLFFGVAAGNMDSMINRYTADRKVRNDDAYTPGGVGGKPVRSSVSRRRSVRRSAGSAGRSSAASSRATASRATSCQRTLVGQSRNVLRSGLPE